jgi:hypothetical protein
MDHASRVVISTHKHNGRLLIPFCLQLWILTTAELALLQRDLGMAVERGRGRGREREGERKRERGGVLIQDKQPQKCSYLVS